MQTKIQSFAQISFCKGCCCGRVDRGKPAFPEDRIKALWKSEKLNKFVQLTISGCLGPCDLTNVALVTLPSGQHWFGKLTSDSDYDLLIDWARRSVSLGRPEEFTAALEAFRFTRWPTPATTTESPSPTTMLPVLQETP